jgi:hypothetical protein
MTREIERCIKTSDGEEVCFPLSMVIESKRAKAPSTKEQDVSSSKGRKKDVSSSKGRKKEQMELVSVHLPKAMLITLDNLVRRGIYPNRSEAIRDALAKLLAQYKDVLWSEGQ